MPTRIHVSLQGSTSGVDEKGVAALKTIELDNNKGGVAVQVRVVQGKEPRHFLAIFGGRLIIYSGGRASSFEVQGGEQDEVLSDTYLLQVRGNAPYNTKAIQVCTMNTVNIFKSKSQQRSLPKRSVRVFVHCSRNLIILNKH